MGSRRCSQIENADGRRELMLSAEQEVRKFVRDKVSSLNHYLTVKDITRLPVPDDSVAMEFYDPSGDLSQRGIGSGNREVNPVRNQGVRQ